MSASHIDRRSLFVGASALAAVAAAGLRPSLAQTNAAESRWTSVGAIRIAAILDATVTLPAADAGLPAGSPSVAMSVMVHVLRYRGETVLVGAGVGDHGGEAKGRLVEGLAELGLTPADIDLVLLTHLHPEHVGGMVERSGAPVFSKARVVSCRTEWRWWNQNERPPGLPERYMAAVPLARMATRPYEQAGRLVTFSGTEVVSAGITGFPALGHTAGHSLFRMEEGSARVLTLGDTVHLPQSQIANPDMPTALDQSSRTAAGTRRWVLEQAARDELTVIGSHIAEPAVARVRRIGSGFTLIRA